MNDKPLLPSPRDESPPENPYQSPQAANASTASFSLASLFLATTLFAVCLGLTIAVPGLGALSFVIATPALARTWWIRNRRKRSGAAMSTGDKMSVFFASTGIVTLLTASSAAAFCCVCYPLGLVGFGTSYGGGNQFGMVLFFAAWPLGFLVGGTVLFFMIRWFWKWGA